MKKKLKIRKDVKIDSREENWRQEHEESEKDEWNEECKEEGE